MTSTELKRDDLVIARCKHPAFGFVTRVGKDWADVEWHGGVGYSYRRRSLKANLIPISGVLSATVASRGNTDAWE
jgi:hypothetical protein